MAKIKITETVLRDSHQSLAATRMTTEEMVPVLKALDRVGYHSLECWGGATFDACLRYLNEDPWERLRVIKSNVRNTKLQMLFRGQNILGYRNYPDDVVEYFVKKSIDNGIEIVRVFDALNDPRNLETSIRAATREKAHVQAAICYTTSPIHNNDTFATYAKQLIDLGADSICIKDMAGLLRPFDAYQLVRALRNAVGPKCPIQLHTHCTSGLGSMTILKAVEAGVDIIDTAISPFSMGTSQPPTESIVATFIGTPYETGLNEEELDSVASYFSKLREKYIANGLIDQKVMKVDITALRSQIPGGMYSNLVAQLKNANKLHLLNAVLEEVPRVRADAGYPPLVTPTSQIIGNQAVLNVSTGERYKMTSNEFKALIHGDYGKTPAAIDQDFARSIIGTAEPITYRPADKLEPELEKLRSKVAPYREQDEDLLTLALFEHVAIRFFEWRKGRKHRLDPNGDSTFSVHPI